MRWQNFFTRKPNANRREDIKRDISVSTEPLILCLLLLLFGNLFFSYVYARGPLLLAFFVLALTVFLPLTRSSLRSATQDNLFLISISCISLALLLSASLASKNIIGEDINGEYYLFQQVLQLGLWPSNVSFTYDSALSVTILPAAISEISSINGVAIFKYLFPILFTIVPLALYRIYSRILTRSYAFVSVFLFVSVPGYIDLIGLGRQEVAEVFLALLVLMSVSLKKSSARTIVIVLLALGVVVSHYSIGFVFVYLLIFSVVAARLFPSRVEKSFDIVPMALGGVVLVTYYLYVAGGSVMVELGNSISAIVNGSGQAFAPSSIPPIVQQAVVFNPSLSFLHWFSRIVQYAVAAILMLGLLTSCRTRKSNSAERKMLPLMGGSLILVIAAAVVPFLGSSLNFSRFFQIGLLFAAPLFPIGIETIMSAIKTMTAATSKNRRFDISIPSRNFATALLFSYLLCTSGWLWAITWDQPTSIVFDWQRMKDSPDSTLRVPYYTSYIVDQDIAGARWIEMHGLSLRLVCSDTRSKSVLGSYGGQDPKSQQYLPNVPSCNDFVDEYVFLSEFNVGSSVILTPYHQLLPLQTMSTQLGSMNVIYSGDTLVYLAPGS